MHAMILTGGTAANRIEEVRVAWERDLELEIAARPGGWARDDPGLREPRVLLERTMAERVHRVAETAAKRLGCYDPFVLYQTPREDPHLSAQALMTETPFAIRLIGPVASRLDDEALAALIGHELGHWLALGPHARPASTVLQGEALSVAPDFLTRRKTVAEFTADRFSLIAAAGKVEAAVRLDVGVATMDSPRALGVREMDHLAELCRQAESGEGRFFVGDYPSSSFRMFATWLFWRSDLHRELTGVGPADIAVRDVDARLLIMCNAALARERNVAHHAAGGSSQEWTAPVGLNESSRAAPPLVGQRTRLIAPVASLIGGFVGTLTHKPTDQVPPDQDASMDIGDLETRFRALERDAARASAPSDATISAELEARFRALEEQEKNR